MRNKTKENPVGACPYADKCVLITKLRALAGESGDIAGYIDDNIHYGRALGYAEGKHAAYTELIGRIIRGDFDSNKEGK